MSDDTIKSGNQTMNATMKKPNYSLEQAHKDVDCYVRDKLPEASRESFELHLLSEQQLQDDVETVLVVKLGLQAIGHKGVVTAIEKDGTGDKDKKSWFFQRWFNFRPAPAFASAAAMALVLTAGIFMFTDNGVRKDDLLAQISAPEGIYASVTLPNVRAGTNGDFQPLAILKQDTKGGWMLMELELSYPEHQNYNVEILSWPEQTNVVSLNSLQPDAQDNLTFALHASELPTGDYLARVVYDGTNSQELIANYAFSVEAGAGGSDT